MSEKIVESKEKKKKLLVLEYNGTRKLLERMYSIDYDIISTRSPVYFLHLLKTNKYDEVVVDYLNPMISPKLLKANLDELRGKDNYWIISYNSESSMTKFKGVRIIDYYKLL